MRGVYSATYPISGVTAAKTLMYLTAPSTAAVEILSAHVTNESNETNEQMKCCLQRIGTLGTPTATSVTPAKHENGDQAAGSTVKGNVTASEPTYTANTEVGNAGFPSLSGWHFEPTEKERMLVPPSGSIGLRLITSSVTSFDCVVSVTFREIG